MIRSISRRLVRQVLLISVVVACLAAAYQLHAAYRSGQEDPNAYLGRISATHVPALSASVWQLDEGQIRHLLAGGKSARFLLPDPVLAYIHTHGLYRASN